MRYTILVVLAALTLTTAAAAQDCGCPDVRDPDREVGVLWRGDRDLTMDEVAGLAAPIMWFSVDEPLAWVDDPMLPDPHPCDPAGLPTPREGSNVRGNPFIPGVVYYQPTTIHLRNGAAHVTRPEEDDLELFDKVEDMVLRFFFYYRRDSGVGEHRHDIELAAFHLVLKKTPEGCREVRLDRIVAFAHGVKWYNNILESRHDLRWPVSLLVEEGKHATCPDRNYDGVYTPGYDVTKHTNDAWGVRDVLGQGTLMGASFKGSHAKARDVAMRMMPPEVDGLCPVMGSRAALSNDILGTYELRAANTVPFCEIDHKKTIDGMMTRHGFGVDQLPKQYENNALRDAAKEIDSPASIVPAIMLRRDGGPALGFSFSLKGLDMGEFWLLPKFNVMSDRVSAEILGTPSASRWADWYFSLGGERREEVSEEIDGQKMVIAEAEYDYAMEWGYKFRFLAPSKIRPFMLGYGFGGLRFGIRSNGFDGLDNPRLIVEIGAGAF